VHERTRGAVLQRDIGFEFEVNHMAYQSDRTLTWKDRGQRAERPRGATNLPKGSVLVGNMGALHAKTDVASMNRGSNVEFEIAHQPETDEGRARLVEALATLERACALLETERSRGRRHVPATKLRAAFGGATGGENRYIAVDGEPTTGAPQATVGIRLERVGGLMENTIGSAVKDDEMPRDRFALGGMRGDQFSAIGRTPGLVRDGIHAYAEQAGEELPEGFPSSALVGVCALLLSYIRAGAAGRQIFLKGMAPLLARTSIGSIMAGDLSDAERLFFEHEGGARFVALWGHILATAQLGELDVPLIALDPSEGEGMELPTALSRRSWLAALAGPEHVDQLTAEHVPAVAEDGLLTAAQAKVLREDHDDREAVEGGPITTLRAQRLTTHRRENLEGFGALGTAHDTVGGVDRVRAPVFELRRMIAMDTHEFAEMALGLFDYVVALNGAEGDEATYAHAEHRASTPSLRQRRRFWWG
jgi:hypothetical protein